MPRSQGTSRKGKPKKNDRAAGMGRALQKSQKPGHGGRPKYNKPGGMNVIEGVAAAAMFANTPMNNAEKNMTILELDHLDDFLMQAEMAGREYECEKAQRVVLDSHGSAYNPGERHIMWKDEHTENQSKIQFTFEELSVPRRPEWNEDTTPQELDRLENEAFLAWRRAIAAKEEELYSQHTDQHAYYSRTVTPYEKNLHVWRQLWRVLERSSCVVCVIDGRNPNFYISDDLKQYTKELGKPMLLVVNKGDYLSAHQRRLWSKYFYKRNWEHAFFSAHLEQAKLDKAAAQNKDNDLPDQDIPDYDESVKDSEQIENDQGKLLTREELTDFMMEFAKKQGCEPNPRYDNRYQFGTVGFPNVGKSSVINVLMGSSKHSHGLTRVAVAAQPGKTKHFQTLLLPKRDDMMLCDCPGLVFPSFVSNTADLIAAGVYPIAQMRDHWPVIELICQRIPREIINASYGIQLPVPSAQELAEKGMGKLPPPSAEDFLTTYCVARSMLAASSGVPDYTRASRIVIKDYVSGKLLYCHPPPDVTDKAQFHLETVKTAISNTAKLRKKLVANQTLHANSDQLYQEYVGDGALVKEAALDENLLKMLGDSAGFATSSGGDRSKAHRSKKKQGKQGKKGRDDDPYGCHKSVDEMLLSNVQTSGVVVNAGKKYSRSNYTRPTSYAGARAACSFGEKVV